MMEFTMLLCINYTGVDHRILVVMLFHFIHATWYFLLIRARDTKKGVGWLCTFF